MAKVLHISNAFDPAGSVTRGTSLLQRFSKHEHAVAVRDREDAEFGLGYQEPPFMRWNTEPGILDSLFRWADCVLFHFVGWDFRRADAVGQPWDGWNNLSKPSAFVNRNVYYDSSKGKFWAAGQWAPENLADYELVGSCHLGARDFLPGCYWLPTLIDIDAPLYLPNWAERSPCVSYAKHAQEFDRMNFGARKMNCAGMKQPRLLWHRQNEATVVIDNYSDGHYGLVSLEVMAQGIPAVVFNAEATREQLCELAVNYVCPVTGLREGFHESPLIEVGPLADDLADGAMRVLRMPAKEYAVLRHRCRTWMENFYNPRRLIAKYWDAFADRLLG